MNQQQSANASSDQLLLTIGGLRVSVDNLTSAVNHLTERMNANDQWKLNLEKDRADKAEAELKRDLEIPLKGTVEMQTDHSTRAMIHDMIKRPYVPVAAVAIAMILRADGLVMVINAVKGVK